MAYFTCALGNSDGIIFGIFYVLCVHSPLYILYRHLPKLFDATIDPSNGGS